MPISVAEPIPWYGFGSQACARLATRAALLCVFNRWIRVLFRRHAALAADRASEPVADGSRKRARGTRDRRTGAGKYRSRRQGDAKNHRQCNALHDFILTLRGDAALNIDGLQYNKSGFLLSAHGSPPWARWSIRVRAGARYS